METLAADSTCPDCSGALTATNSTMLSFPPKKGVSCACGFNGFREALITEVKDENDMTINVIYS